MSATSFSFEMARLRQLLSQAPSTRLFARIFEGFQQWEDPDTIQLALDYTEEHLRLWPDAYRTVALRLFWPTLPKGKPPVYAGLARGLQDQEDSLSLAALKALVQAPVLEHLTSLNLLPHTLQAKRLRLLLESPHLVNIQELSLCLGKTALVEFLDAEDSPLLHHLTALTLHGHLTTTNVRLLADSPCMASLRKLALVSSADQPYEVTSLTGSRSMSQVEELSVAISSKPGHSELAVILQSPHLTRLTSLKLHAFCEFSDEDFATMVDDPGMGKLTSFSMEHVEMEDATLIDFANSPHVTGLKALHFSYIHSDAFEKGPEGSEGLQSLVRSPRLANLTSLKLTSVALKDKDVEAIAHSPHMAGLRELDLSNNPIEDDGVIAIANSPYMANLTSLSLGDTCVGNDGIKAIAKSPHMANLTVLDLYGYFGYLEGDQTSKGLIEIAKSPHMANLEVLNILHRQINGFRSSKALFTSTQLKEQTRLDALAQLDTKPLRLLAGKLNIDSYKDMEGSELLDALSEHLLLTQK